jgi:hypothetical protein
MPGGRDDQDAGHRSQGPTNDPAGRGADNAGLSYFRSLRSAGPMLGAGIQFAASVILMFFLGKWGDDEFGTTPWLMLTGLAFGFAAGMVSFVRAARRAGDEADSSKSGSEVKPGGSKKTGTERK